MNFIISITSPEALPVLTGVCEDMALPLNVTLSGRGTAVKSMLDVLGIESNLKRIMFSVANEEKTREFITRQKRQLHIGVPGHGIVIAVPVNSIGGGKTVAYLRGEDGTAKYTPSLNYAYELIVVIANEGRTDTVMNAARAAGARGGTVLHGKGTGSEAAMKFLNISIADEKEVILIVAPTAEKTAIMSEILKKAGPDTDAKAIAFSLPTSAVAGFGFSGEAE
ncbi:MAG: P-II family nitrogen regulator [Firmicutes bacterium]|nr:P-II family nitrogen regulator [Bacillota bacterium]